MIFICDVEPGATLLLFALHTSQLALERVYGVTLIEMLCQRRSIMAVVITEMCHFHASVRLDTILLISVLILVAGGLH